MMGPQRLNAIRQELEQALSRTGQDPIQWLEEQLRAAKGGGGVPAGEGIEVLESRRRLLEKHRPAGRRPRRVRRR